MRSQLENSLVSFIMTMLIINDFQTVHICNHNDPGIVLLFLIFFRHFVVLPRSLRHFPDLFNPVFIGGTIVESCHDIGISQLFIKRILCFLDTQKPNLPDRIISEIRNKKQDADSKENTDTACREQIIPDKISHTEQSQNQHRFINKVILLCFPVSSQCKETCNKSAQNQYEQNMYHRNHLHVIQDTGNLQNLLCHEICNRQIKQGLHIPLITQRFISKYKCRN